VNVDDHVAFFSGCGRCQFDLVHQLSQLTQPAATLVVVRSGNNQR
jgi:hypothetical protein